MITQNWTPFWKYITLLNCSLYMFLGNFTALSIAPLTPIYLEYFNTTLTRVGLLVSEKKDNTTWSAICRG
jgi:hypothetical protein